MRGKAMEYSAQRSTWFHGASLICLLFVVTVVASIDVTIQEEPSNLVSIEDSIDVDGGPSSQTVTDNNRRTVNVQLHSLPKHNTGSAFRESDDDDDEDALTSGSGSGSGDTHLVAVTGESNGNMTPTQTRPPVITTSSPPINSTQQPDNEDPANVTRANMTFDLDHTFADNDNDENNDIHEEDADIIYDLPDPSSSLTSNNVLSAPSWSKWSDWFLASTTSKLRVRNCEIEGEEVNEAACEGVRMQLRACDKNNPSQCGKIQDIKTLPIDRCDDTYKDMQQGMFLKAPSPVSPSPKLKAPLAKKPGPDLCKYSLYDTYRQKYVFTGWNLTDLISKSKVKRWCDKTNGQYLVMSTPKDHCRQYYKDLCKLSERCRSDKPTKERGDFAEGCWRNLVYGDMLPVGLSNKQTIVYFICQRFAAQSKLGKVFGYKETYFGTLYNTNTRSPTLSLNKITRLGDETWPDTKFFIEHGLVEIETDALWLFRKPKKGILSLHDLDRCSDDESCELGLRQILPYDYADSPSSGYTPTHLMWPELMPPDPDPRLATFTLTNIAPLQNSLFEEWHETIIKVRQYAIEQCGIPVFLDSTFAHQTDFSTHRVNKSAMYVASGILPSTGPPVTTGRDIHVPFLFWIAGCCVKQRSTFTSNMENDNGNSSNFTANTWNDNYVADEITNVTAFSLYIVNTIGNHVIPAPVLQLEMLLQDIYKSTTSDPDVTLFPGYDSTCSDLKNDASNWFQK